MSPVPGPADDRGTPWTCGSRKPFPLRSFKAICIRDRGEADPPALSELTYAVLCPGKPVNFDDYGDIHIPAVILTTFLRELPQPRPTFRAYEQILGITSWCLPCGVPVDARSGGQGLPSTLLSASGTVGHGVHGQAGPPLPS